MTKIGRPFIYQDTFPETLFDLMCQGKKGAHLHAHFGVTYKTFWEWRRKYPQFNEAYEKGFEECEKYWENIGIKMIEEKDDKAFKPWIAFMNRNFGWARHGAESQGSTTVNINNLQINNQLTKDELIAQITNDLKDLNVLDVQFEEMPKLEVKPNESE